MIKIIIDPTGHFAQRGFSHESVYAQSMTIIGWVLNPRYENESLLATVKEQYRFGFTPFEGFTVGAVGTMYYPGDPELYPLLSIQKNGDDLLWFYEHDWITITNPEGGYTTARVD